MVSKLATLVEEDACKVDQQRSFAQFSTHASSVLLFQLDTKLCARKRAIISLTD